MWVVLHDQQVLGASLRARALVGGDEAGDVVVLQQRQAVDGALVEEVLAVADGENLHGDRLLVQGAAVHGAVPSTSDQLQEGAKERSISILYIKIKSRVEQKKKDNLIKPRELVKNSFN